MYTGLILIRPLAQGDLLRPTSACRRRSWVQSAGTGPAPSLTSVIQAKRDTWTFPLPCRSLADPSTAPCTDPDLSPSSARPTPGWVHWAGMGSCSQSLGEPPSPQAISISSDALPPDPGPPGRRCRSEWIPCSSIPPSLADEPPAFRARSRLWLNWIKCLCLRDVLTDKSFSLSDWDTTMMITQMSPVKWLWKAFLPLQSVNVNGFS